MNLTPCQEAANEAFLSFMLDPQQSEMIISGFAGTGKSTLTRHILDNVERNLKVYNLLIGQDVNQTMPVHVTATTNKAAQVIGQMAHTTPQTIHSLLGLKVSNDYSTGKSKLIKGKNYRILERSLVIIDEASYIDSALLAMIRNSTLNCKVLYIGDPYQLAPTFEKVPCVFEQGMPQAHLNQVMRNTGPITQLANQYRQTVEDGIFQPAWFNGQEVIHADGETFRSMIEEAFGTTTPGLDNRARVLAWTNERVHQYNDYIRRHQGRGETLEVGERVITNKPLLGTSYGTDSHLTVTEVGEETEQLGIPGYYVELAHHLEIFLPTNQRLVNQKLKELARDKDWSTYFTIKEQWGDLRPLHASTVHKSQGSTYQHVFIDLSDIGRCNLAPDVARMLYVAISRASEQVVLYGQLPERYGGMPLCLPQPSSTVPTRASC